jgi:hypothetical protein
MMVMSKKKLLTVAFVSILSALMLAGMQPVNVVRAAPDAPRVFLQSPQSRVYASNYVPLELTANSSNTPSKDVFFVSVVYFVDGEKQPEQHSSLPMVPYYGIIMHLSTGTHIIQVNASAQAYMLDSYTIVYSPISYFDSGKIIVTVNPAPSSSPSIEPSPSITPSPSPSLTPSPTLAPTIEPTIEPTSNPKQQTGFLGTNLPTEYGYAIVAVLVIVAVAGLSLVYFKKLRK